MALMSLAFLPFYIKLLGAEAYGFVGLHISVFAIISFFDMGLSTAVNRSLSLTDFSNDAERQDGRNLVHTYEIIYWGVGIALGIVIWSIAPLIAKYWINLDKITIAEAQRAISLIALVILFQWPMALYTGCMLGMEDQVRLNGIKIVQATLQWGGAVSALLLFSPTIEVYFIWQCCVGLLSVIAMRIFVLMRFATAGKTSKPAFEVKHWNANKDYFKGLTSLTLFGVILTQTDRFIISKLLPMQALGYYTFAFSLANSLQYLGQPIYAAIFPRLTRLISSANAGKELASFYHRTAQVLTTLVAPICLILAYFSRDILQIWTKQPEVVENTYAILSLLAIGSALNVIMLPPLALQLAAKWTTLSTYKNLLAIALYLPLLYYMVKMHGLAGASVCWIVLNSAYVLFEIPLMHRRLLVGEKRRWYLQDLIMPTAIAAALFIIFQIVMTQGMRLQPGFFSILTAGVFVLGGTVLSMPVIRTILQEQWQTLRLKL